MLGRTPLRSSGRVNRMMKENVVGGGKNFVPISVRFEEFKRKKAASKKRPAADVEVKKKKKKRRRSKNNKSTLFEGKGKLYAYEGHVWSPLGSGSIAIVEENALNQLIVEMRDEKTSEIDHQFKCGSEPLKSNGPKSWLFSGMMIVENQSRDEKSFAVRFTSDKIAKRFKSVFEEAQEHNAKVGNEGEQTTPVKESTKPKKNKSQDFQEFLETRKRALSEGEAATTTTSTKMTTSSAIGWSIDLTTTCAETEESKTTMTTTQKTKQAMTTFLEAQITEEDRSSRKRVLKKFHRKGMSGVFKIKRAHLEAFLRTERLCCNECSDKIVIGRVRKILQQKYSMMNWSDIVDGHEDESSSSSEEEKEEVVVQNQDIVTAEEIEKNVEKEEEEVTTTSTTTQAETPVVVRTSSASLEDTIEKIKNDDDEQADTVTFGEKHKDLRRRIREKLTQKRSRDSSFTSSNHLEQEFERAAKKFRSSEVETEKNDEWKLYCAELREHAQRSIESMRAFEEKLSKASNF